MPFESFYQGKKILVTGDTGFKGAWLVTWLKQLGAEVYGLALKPNTEPALYNLLQLGDNINHTDLDIRNAAKLQALIKKLRPQVVFHLAAQALVRLSYQIPLETLDTNVMGTANLLQAIHTASYTPDNPCIVVVVTSDKCYENRETYTAYCEENEMGGHDTYSMSKGAAELVVASWRRSFFTPQGGAMPHVSLASCRAGNVIGGGDWAADRIVVDSIKSLMNNEPIRVRKPLSIRPWQHVLEPLSGYLQLAATMALQPASSEVYCSAWNFGPGRESERPVSDLCKTIVRHWGEGCWEHTPDSNDLHEATFLKLSINKSWHYLRWQPVWDFDSTVRHTVDWYRLAQDCDFDSDTLINETSRQIQLYMKDAKFLSLKWMCGQSV